jgi:YD repeat-containing protein
MTTDSNRQTQAPAVPLDAAIFTFSSSARWALFPAMLLALAEATVLFIQAWSTIDPTTRLTQIPEGVFFALVAELNWRLFRRSRDRVAVNEEGIWSISRNQIGFIPWRNVAHVRANDAAQRLDLIDAAGSTVIHVDYQFREFDRLRDFILSHTLESAQSQSAGITAFHRGFDTRMVYLGLAALLFLIALMVHGGVRGPEYRVPVLLGMIATGIALAGPLSLTIERDVFVIHYVVYQRSIPFNSVIGIAFSDRRFRGNIWAGVVVALNRSGIIRLGRFSEGSVALYEALRAAWKAAAAEQGFALPAQEEASLPATQLLQSVSKSQSGSRVSRRTVFAVVAAILLAAVFSFTVLHRTVDRMISEAAAARASVAPDFHRLNGPVASLSELRGSGRIYLLQVGPHAAPYALQDFAIWLRNKYNLDVQVLPAMPAPREAWDTNHRQFVAEQLYAQIKQQHPDLAADENAYLIGFTDADMYSVRYMWSSTFSQRDSLRTAIISSDGLEDSAAERVALGAGRADAEFQARLRRILLKDVAVLYWHLPVNNHFTSLLHDPLDPDLPVEDIFKSDLDPALSAAGARVYEPCIYFTYSTRDGIKILPGSVVRECGALQEPMEDESVEVFEFDLRIGLLMDKHTDIYLPDTIPIEFERVTRSGARGRNPFGISGADNYDQFLGSPDNIHVFLEHADGARDNLVRYPEWLPVLPLVKYVGGHSEEMRVGRSLKRVWQYEMAWHSLPYEHYDLHRFNGDTETYLPSDNPDVPSVMVDYKDSQGRDLRIERDSSRHLAHLTSPNGRWLGVGTVPDGRIIAIDDDRNRTVLYSYDMGHRLASVTYPSGQIYRYEYDDRQNMLAFSVAADAHSEPQIILRNEYQGMLLTRQTLPDGSVFTYSYDGSDPYSIHHITVNAPGQHIFDIAIDDNGAIVHERVEPSQAAKQ